MSKDDLIKYNFFNLKYLEKYLGIKLKWYQKIVLYIYDKYLSLKR